MNIVTLAAIVAAIITGILLVQQGAAVPLVRAVTEAANHAEQS